MAEGKWTGCNVSLHWRQTTFLDCFCSKRLNKCEVAESNYGNSLLVFHSGDIVVIKN